MKKAFTLTETLITLVVIGIIAALALPALIQKHNNRIVELKLKKFYVNINQAIHMAYLEHGNYELWYDDLSSMAADDEGNITYDTSEIETWCNKYLIPYLNVVKTESSSNGLFIMYFADGSAFSSSNNTTRDWFFYPGNVNECLDSCSQDGSYYYCNGRCRFAFNFCPICNTEDWKYHYKKGMEPFKFKWGGEIDSLTNDSAYGCNNGANHAYCTAIIQMNDWKIPDDYPFKVKY